MFKVVTFLFLFLAVILSIKLFGFVFSLFLCLFLSSLVVLAVRKTIGLSSGCNERVDTFPMGVCFCSSCGLAIAICILMFSGVFSYIPESLMKNAADFVAFPELSKLYLNSDLSSFGYHFGFVFLCYALLIIQFCMFTMLYIFSFFTRRHFQKVSDIIAAKKVVSSLFLCAIAYFCIFELGFRDGRPLLDLVSSYAERLVFIIVVATFCMSIAMLNMQVMVVISKWLKES